MTTPDNHDFESLYRQHLEQLDQWLSDSIERAERQGSAFDGVLFHAGRPIYYHRDDRLVPFRPTAHFRRYIPTQDGPEHVVAARPGERPVVIRVIPRDFWFENEAPAPSHWESSVDLHEVASFAQVAGILDTLGETRWAYLGDSAEAAAELGLAASAIEPASLLSPLDWYRAVKTDYEVALTRVACERTARAHRQARPMLLAGATELEVHRMFLEQTGHRDHELAYDSIVAYDEKAAILHYQKKRQRNDVEPRVLLLDAGAEYCGYAADITRTWTTPQAPATFRSIVAAVDAMERRLVSMVRPGRSYVEIHLECHRQTAEILTVHGILKCSVEEAVEKRLTRTFMPHGVGHLIGLQVHDVGGHQSAPDGGLTPPPEEHVLRNTRTLEPGHLVTVEPGLYFVPMLLDNLRGGDMASVVDWRLVDELTPCGGVRIEDDILCTANGYEDLTRALTEAS